MKKFYFLLSLLILVMLLFPTKTIDANVDNISNGVGILTEVDFRYDIYPDKKIGIPRVRISQSDYETGNIVYDTYEYDKGTISLPNGAKASTSCYGYGNHSHLIKTTGKLIAYWNSCYEITKKTNGKTTQQLFSELFSFDLDTKKWSSIVKVSDEIIEFYPNFRGYAIFPKNYYSSDKNDKAVKIYSLDTKKLLLRLGHLPRDDDFEYQDKFLDETKGSRLLYYFENYKKLQKAGAYPWVKEDFWYDATRTMSLTNTGEKAEVPGSVGTQVGNLVYGYEKPNYNYSIFGYWEGGKFHPLHDKTKHASATFSPNKKYLILRLIPADRNKWSHTVDYTSVVYDAKTAKKRYSLPIYANINYYHLYTWLYGDEIVRINFETDKKVVNQNLHLNSGIVTAAENLKHYNVLSYTGAYYSGDYNQLISPEVPAAIYFNGIQIKYTGQGSFVGENGLWYVPVRDFAVSVGLSIQATASKITLKSDKYKAELNLKEAITYNGRVYFPYPAIADQLGANVLLISDDHGTKGANIYSFISKVSEQEMLNMFPNLEVGEPTFNSDYVYLRKGTDIQMIPRSDEYKNYRIGKNEFIFKDGILINVISDFLVDTHNKSRTDIDMTMNEIIDANGKGTKKKLTKNEYLLSYPKNDETLVYLAAGAYPAVTILILNQ
ncbi:MAG: hypothetical protein P0Y55_17785 [Candidatus Cohnella colombiensis]|uniref:Copper amine oxidase-like N-terminal domain-containing protein n=1 Tax=Candidatus Cohnella colombiensis TaxID=3121368 RepID=A0AA95EWQ8_9BACL|nr:MAG: hypothetical protein P0Y55_17785 [Cohnella sp.]